jgi:2-methylfumaryl-CoA isomerase
MNPDDKPLAGLRVVEISAFVAAPLGGATLARLGAEVIRVDPPGGGVDIRRWPLHEGRSLYWAGLNRGKRSVTVDLRSTRGQEVAAKLAAAAGSVLTNLPGPPALGYEALRRRRPDLLMVRIVGRLDGAAAVDYTVNAGTGFPWLTGPAGHPGPINHVLPAWDVASGYYAATQLLAGERHRLLTGEGRLATISLADVALRVADHLGLIQEAELIEEPRGRFGNHVFGTYGRDFRTRDGRFVMVLALTPRQWRSLGAATGAPFARVAPDLEREEVRWRHRSEVDALLEAWIADRTLDEVSAAFDRNGVLWGPFRTFKELLREDPRVEELRAGRAPDPVLGADTQSVLAELGEDATALRAEGVVGFPDPLG